MKINLSSIRIDGGTQPRVEINEATVADYAEAYKAGEKLPPLIVFFDGADHWLADGFHRWHGARAAGLTGIDAEERQGTKRDAVLFSLSANAEHGLRRSNADKRKAIATCLADSVWGSWSDREIARICRVGHHLVADVKDKQRAAQSANVTGFSPTDDNGMTGFSSSEKTYAAKGGKVTTMQTSGIAASNKARAKDKPKVVAPDDAEDAGIDLANEVALMQRQIDEQQARIVNLSSSDAARQIDSLTVQLQHAMREKGEEMDKNARISRERDRLQKWQAQVVSIIGSPDPAAALAWVKNATALNRRQAA